MARWPHSASTWSDPVDGPSYPRYAARAGVRRSTLGARQGPVSRPWLSLSSDIGRKCGHRGADSRVRDQEAKRHEADRVAPCMGPRSLRLYVGCAVRFCSSQMPRRAGRVLSGPPMRSPVVSELGASRNRITRLSRLRNCRACDLKSTREAAIDQPSQASGEHAGKSFHATETAAAPHRLDRRHCSCRLAASGLGHGADLPRPPGGLLPIARMPVRIRCLHLVDEAELTT